MRETCLVPGCEDPPSARGLCPACYQWNRYHVRAGHGLDYMRRYSGRVARLAARAELQLSARRRLRVVGGG